MVAPLVVALIASALLSVPTVSGQQDPHLVLYKTPLDTWVEDPFRPPAHIGASGNRGLQYGSSQGQGVRAAADGQVQFAGQVGVRKVVTVKHLDGVRTTYTGLSSVSVGRGDWVRARQVIAVALNGFHFGARIGDHYLDPQILLDASEPDQRARLLPEGGGFGG